MLTREIVQELSGAAKSRERQNTRLDNGSREQAQNRRQADKNTLLGTGSYGCFRGSQEYPVLSEKEFNCSRMSSRREVLMTVAREAINKVSPSRV